MLPSSAVHYGAIVVAALFGSLLLAALRNPLEALLTDVANGFRDLGGACERELAAAHTAVRRVAGAAAAGLHGDAGGSVVGTIVLVLSYAALFVVVLFGDAYLVYLRFAAMFGSGNAPVLKLPFGMNLELLASLVWLCSISILGLSLFDLLGISHGHTPLSRLDGRRHRRMLIFVLIELWLGFLGTAMFFVWGQFQIFGQAHHGLALDFMVIMAALVIGAVVCAHWAIPAAAGALWYLALLIVAGILAVAAAALRILVALVNFLCRVLQRLVEVGGFVGRLLWDGIGQRRARSASTDTSAAIGNGNGAVNAIPDILDERREV